MKQNVNMKMQNLEKFKNQPQQIKMITLKIFFANNENSSCFKINIMVHVPMILLAVKAREETEIG